MHTTNLRKVGGSVMLAVPPVLLKLLQLEAGASVAVDVENGRLIVQPKQLPRYTLAELLEASDYSQSISPEDREWLDAPPVGRELLCTAATSTWSPSTQPSATSSGGIVRC
jgi:antitoxin ChpS